MEQLEEGYYYHIYNRGAGKASIFFSDIDYKLFIEKYFYYLYITAETYAWCLLKNHFHFLIRIRTLKEQAQIFEHVKSTYPKNRFYGGKYSILKPYSASQQLSHLFNSYTKTINKKNDRSGTLLEGTFKRKKILDEGHFLHMACYIHRNPIHHKFSKTYSDYPFSSYTKFTSPNETLIEADKLLGRFGGKENFIEAHQQFKLELGEEFYLE